MIKGEEVEGEKKKGGGNSFKTPKEVFPWANWGWGESIGESPKKKV